MIKPNTWLGETEEFFFKGASFGWAGGNDGVLLNGKDGTPGMEEWREVIYHEGMGYAGYHFADRWGIDPDSGQPSGHMIITHWNIPVWGMWVGGGSYDKEIFSFLREVLKETYAQNQFFGGRGPREYRKGNLIYQNSFDGDFGLFAGKESIFYVNDDGSKVHAGSHDYWGGSFVFQKRS